MEQNKTHFVGRTLSSKSKTIKQIKKILNKNKMSHKYVKNILKENNEFRQKINLKAVNSLVQNRRMSI